MRRSAGYSEDSRLPVAPAVPNLPGHNIQPQFHKPKTTSLKYIHGIPIIEDKAALEDPLNLSRYNYLPSQEKEALQSRKQSAHEPSAALQDQTNKATWGIQTMRWTGVKTPGWLLYDNKVLRFNAYSIDRVQYSPLEDVRVRKFELKYNLEDDTMEIREPQEANSGLPHGKYLQRNKVKLMDGSLLNWRHIRLGQELIIYSRKFHVVSCDQPTRDFYAEKDVPQPEDGLMPEGKFDVTKKKEKEREEAAKSPAKPRNQDDPFDETRGSGAFFEFFSDRKPSEHLDGKILRFFCCWDDTKRMFGQKLPFALHYYLKDDTIEVVETHKRNTGRDPFPLLLSRCKLPKSPNVPPVGGRPLSPRSRRLLKIQYYYWQDLKIGEVVKVYGRDLLIYDVDKSTKKWYQDSLRLPDSAFKPIEVDFDMGPKRPPMQVPPNTLGIGTDEDSMQNVLHLVPRRPVGDYNNYMENWNKVFRFSGHMVPVRGHALVGPHDASRKFVISYHLLDKTISIWEIKQPNSGIKGGTFLERTKVRKPGKEEFFTDQDFYVGATLVIFARGWELQDADTFTLKHMESEPERYPLADCEKVIPKLQGAISQPGVGEQLQLELIKQDNEGHGYVTYKQLHAALKACGVNMTLQEVITVVRHVGADQQGVVVEQLLYLLGLAALPSKPADWHASEEPHRSWVHPNSPGRNENEQPGQQQHADHGVYRQQTPHGAHGISPSKPAPAPAPGPGRRVAWQDQVHSSSTAQQPQQPQHLQQQVQAAPKPHQDNSDREQASLGKYHQPQHAWRDQLPQHAGPAQPHVAQGASKSEGQSGHVVHWREQHQGAGDHPGEPPQRHYYSQEQSVPYKGQQPPQASGIDNRVLGRMPSRSEDPVLVQPANNDWRQQARSEGRGVPGTPARQLHQRDALVAVDSIGDAWAPMPQYDQQRHARDTMPVAKQPPLPPHPQTGYWPAGHRISRDENHDQSLSSSMQPMHQSLAPHGQGLTAGFDPRFTAPPGSIGAWRESSSAGSSVFGSEVAHASSGTPARFKQPASLWQTTNQAAGGVYNERSFRVSK